VQASAAECQSTPVVDACSNIAGVQVKVPAGYTASGGRCTKAPRDVCANIAGVQAAVPAGHHSQGARCVANPPAPAKPAAEQPAAQQPHSQPAPRVYDAPARPIGYSAEDAKAVPAPVTITPAQSARLARLDAQGVDVYMLLALSRSGDSVNDELWPELAPHLQHLTRYQVWGYLRIGRAMERERAIEIYRQRDLLAAMGLMVLEKGLNDPDVRAALAREVLADDNISIYSGGRDDIEAGIIDPRVLVALRYLRVRCVTVEVSSLVSGHSVFTAGGSLSLHSVGQAADIAALSGVRINAAAQAPVPKGRREGVVERAVRDLASLPKELRVDEVISLWNVGGPSFALPDHDDHIHVGFAN
jgi:hypothetical protein